MGIVLWLDFAGANQMGEAHRARTHAARGDPRVRTAGLGRGIRSESAECLFDLRRGWRLRGINGESRLPLRGARSSPRRWTAPVMEQSESSA